MAVKAQDDSFSDLSTPKSPNSTTEKSTSQTHPPTSQNQDLLHDSHYHTRHNQHKHMHDAVVTETISVKDTQNDVCTHIFHEASETQPKVEMQPVTTESGRGRSRIIRKGGRSSSAESSSSTQSLDQDAAIKAVIDLVLRYSETGDYRELARTARDTGIPEHLRRVCTPAEPAVSRII